MGRNGSGLGRAGCLQRRTPEPGGAIWHPAAARAPGVRKPAAHRNDGGHDALTTGDTLRLGVGIGARLFESADGGRTWDERAREAPNDAEPRIRGATSGFTPPAV